jgi:phosphohistidine phosphatase
MKTLLIQRHAKSSWSDAGLADHDRPLNKRGKRQAPHMGELLRQQDLLPDLILSSTAKRAEKTAEAIAEASGYEGEIRLSRDLYAAPPEAYLEALHDLPDEYGCVMVVGHNPGMEELLDVLTGESASLPTAALAQVELGIEHWSQVSQAPLGKLVNIWLPVEG